MQLHPKVSRDHFNAERNLGVLLMEFFELYGRNFHYDSNGISLLRGGSYFHKKRKGFYNSQKPFLLSIEDPQTPGKSCITVLDMPKDRRAIPETADAWKSSLPSCCCSMASDPPSLHTIAALR